MTTPSSSWNSRSGALGVLDTSWVQRSGPNPMEIRGTKGYVGRDGGGLMLSSTDLQVEGIQAIMPTRMGMPCPCRWISGSARSCGTDMTITVEDGRNLTEMLERAYQAARTGKEVKF